MATLHVVNIKCGGCAKHISEKLSELGCLDVKVSPEKQTVSFKSGEVAAAKRALHKMGYPEVGSAAAKRLDKKAQSYVSCAIGRWG